MIPFAYANEISSRNWDKNVRALSGLEVPEYSPTIKTLETKSPEKTLHKIGKKLVEELFEIGSQSVFTCNLIQFEVNLTYFKATFIARSSPK